MTPDAAKRIGSAIQKQGGDRPAQSRIDRAASKNAKK